MRRSRVDWSIPTPDRVFHCEFERASKTGAFLLSEGLELIHVKEEGALAG